MTMATQNNPTKKKGAGIAFVLPGATHDAIEAREPAPAGMEAVRPPSPSPRTGVGLLTATVFESQRLEGRISELESEVKQLEAERGAQLMDPRTVVPSKWANRHPDAFAGPEFSQLKREIQDAGGNVQPIKVRPITKRGDSQARYEIVFGHRRHRACLDLELPVLAVVQELDDNALFVQMERENRGRENLSAWEQGRMYLRALEEGLFTSNIKLAAAIGRDASDVGKAMRIAKLPMEVTGAFPSPNAILFRWVADLERALRLHPAAVLAEARDLGRRAPSVPAAEVFSRLTSCLRSPETRGVGPSHPPRELRLGVGMAKLSLGDKDRVTLDLDAKLLPPERWDEFEKLLQRFFTRA
jgi:ParB family transcriptional regulator, chromosome partitioning protein